MYGKWLARSLIVGVLAFGVMTFAPNANIQQSGVTAVPEAQARDRRRSERRRGGGGVGFGITIDLGKIFSGPKKKKRKAKKPRRRKPEKRKARRKPEKKREKKVVVEEIPELPIMKFTAVTAVAGWKKYYASCEYDVLIGWVIVKEDSEGKYCIWMGGECAEKNSSKKGGKCTCNPGFDEKTYPNCKPHGWKDPVQQAGKQPTKERKRADGSRECIPYASYSEEKKRCVCDKGFAPIVRHEVLEFCLPMFVTTKPIGAVEKSKEESKPRSYEDEFVDLFEEFQKKLKRRAEEQEAKLDDCGKCRKHWLGYIPSASRPNPPKNFCEKSIKSIYGSKNLTADEVVKRIIPVEEGFRECVGTLRNPRVLDPNYDANAPMYRWCDTVPGYLGSSTGRIESIKNHYKTYVLDQRKTRIKSPVSIVSVEWNSGMRKSIGCVRYRLD